MGNPVRLRSGTATVRGTGFRPSSEPDHQPEDAVRTGLAEIKSTDTP